MTGGATGRLGLCQTHALGIGAAVHVAADAVRVGIAGRGRRFHRRGCNRALCAELARALASPEHIRLALEAAAGSSVHAAVLGPMHCALVVHEPKHLVALQWYGLHGLAGGLMHWPESLQVEGPV